MIKFSEWMIAREAEEETQKLVKKDCGIHSGITGGPCRKCEHEGKLHANPKFRKGLQAGGTPAVALLGDKVGERK